MGRLGLSCVFVAIASSNAAGGATPEYTRTGTLRGRMISCDCQEVSHILLWGKQTLIGVTYFQVPYRAVSQSNPYLKLVAPRDVARLKGWSN